MAIDFGYNVWAYGTRRYHWVRQPDMSAAYWKGACGALTEMRVANGAHIARGNFCKRCSQIRFRLIMADAGHPR